MLWVLPQARDLSSLCGSWSLLLPCLLLLPALLVASASSELWLTPAHYNLSTFLSLSPSGHFSLSFHHGLIYSPTEPPAPTPFLLLAKRHTEQLPCVRQVCLDRRTQSKFVYQKQQCLWGESLGGVSRLKKKDESRVWRE